MSTFLAEVRTPAPATAERRRSLADPAEDSPLLAALSSSLLLAVLLLFLLLLWLAVLLLAVLLLALLLLRLL